MRKTDRKIVLLFCIILSAIVVAVFSGCDLFRTGDDGPPPADCSNGDNFPGEEEKPHLEQFIRNLGVEFAPYDSSTNRAGAFLFHPHILKPIIEFGPDAIQKAGGISAKDNPAFEYRLAEDAYIFAVCDGIVQRCHLRGDSHDYAVMTRLPRSDLEVIYDHITSPRVSIGDTLFAGDTLGRAGLWEGTDWGRTEIQFNCDSTSQTQKVLAYCPFLIFDPDYLDEYIEKVSRLITEWEAFKGDTSIYDEDSFLYPCCLSESVIP